MAENNELTPAERSAIRTLVSLAKRWPKSLLLFANGNGLSIRKAEFGAFPSPDTEVEYIIGIRNEGGDGGDKL